MKEQTFENILCVVTNSTMYNQDAEEVVLDAIKGGAEIIQLREKSWNPVKIREEAKKLVKLCHDHNVLFVLNGFAQIAMDIGADGVHYDQKQKSFADIRETVGENFMIGVTASSVEEAIELDSEAIDYLFLGPIYPTAGKDFTLGVEAIHPVVSQVIHPVFAWGGISRETISEATKEGAQSVAVCQDIVTAKDSKKAAAEIVMQLKGGKMYF